MDYVAIYREGRLMTVLGKTQLRVWLIDNAPWSDGQWEGKNWSDEALIAGWHEYQVTFRPCKTTQVPILEKMFHNDKK